MLLLYLPPQLVHMPYALGINKDQLKGRWMDEPAVTTFGGAVLSDHFGSYTRALGWGPRSARGEKARGQMEGFVSLTSYVCEREG